jgi:predicted ATP-grasp superfamily ATP-dependent carboligase
MPKTKQHAIKGRDLISQLYRAVVRYVNKNKGTVVVIGGIQIQHVPGQHSYYVAVKVTGKVPSFAEE